MKIEHIQVYGSAGGIERKGDVTAHVVLSKCDTVESARALLGAADDLLEQLVLALLYVESALEDRGYKPNSVKIRTEAIRAAIAKAGG